MTTEPIPPKCHDDGEHRFSESTQDQPERVVIQRTCLVCSATEVEEVAKPVEAPTTSDPAVVEPGTGTDATL